MLYVLLNTQESPFSIVLYFCRIHFNKALYWEGYVHTACPLNKMFNNILNEAQLYLTSCSLWRRNNARSSAVKYCKFRFWSDTKTIHKQYNQYHDTDTDTFNL